MTTFFSTRSSGAPVGDYVMYKSSQYFTFVHWDGTVATILGTEPLPKRTFIIVNQPTNATTTASTTLDIDITYGIGEDLSSFSLNGSLPSKIGIQIQLQNNTTSSTIDLGTDFNISTSSGRYTYATTTTQSQGDYTLIASLIGVYGTYLPPPENCTPLPPFQNCEGETESRATIATYLPPPTFSLANGTLPYLGFDTNDPNSRNALATTTCDLLHVGGCFQNALAFLFYPTSSLNQFSELWRTIQSKPPFGYVSQTLNSLRSLNASSTPAFSFGSLPLMDTIFTPFRTGLAALLWLGFFIAFYRGRLRHLDI